MSTPWLKKQKDINEKEYGGCSYEMGIICQLVLLKSTDCMSVAARSPLYRYVYNGHLSNFISNLFLHQTRSSFNTELL